MKQQKWQKYFFKCELTKAFTGIIRSWNAQFSKLESTFGTKSSSTKSAINNNSALDEELNSEYEEDDEEEELQLLNEFEKKFTVLSKFPKVIGQIGIQNDQLIHFSVYTTWCFENNAVICKTFHSMIDKKTLQMVKFDENNDCKVFTFTCQMVDFYTFVKKILSDSTRKVLEMCIINNKLTIESVKTQFDLCKMCDLNQEFTNMAMIDANERVENPYFNSEMYTEMRKSPNIKTWILEKGLRYFTYPNIFHSITTSKPHELSASIYNSRSCDNRYWHILTFTMKPGFLIKNCFCELHTVENTEK